jgi:hypothetical protein
VFAAALGRDDERRAADVIHALNDHGLRFAVTGSLAIDLQLHAHGRPVEKRALNDIDLVIESFASIPESLAGLFLLHHVHPDATDGRTLLQLVDARRALRIDLFRELGTTLSRAGRCDDLSVLSIADLMARATALVCGRLGRGRTLDPKHAIAFRRLRGLARPELLAAAWDDHRQQVEGDIHEAEREAARLLDARPELMVPDEYSADAPPCAKCRSQGPFRPAPHEQIVEVLGYC